MYTSWTFDPEKRVATRAKTDGDAAKQESRRRLTALELVSNVNTLTKEKLDPLSASECRSVMFRQRGVPSVDCFTADVVGSFRKAAGYDPKVTGLTRKFMPLNRWMGKNSVMTMWTIEPVVASTLVRGNSTNVGVVKEAYENELVMLEPMSSTTHRTAVLAGNEIRGRWAGWLVWRSTLDAGPTDAVCVMCNLSSTTIMFSFQSTGTKLVHMVMTPESVNMLATHARSMAAGLGVSVSTPMLTSTKLVIQPTVTAGGNTSLKIFGNGSMQICGRPLDVEVQVKAAFSVVKAVVEAEPNAFISSMRVVDQFVG